MLLWATKGAISNHSAELSPSSEGAENFMFATEKAHVALVLWSLLQDFAECQLVSTKLFPSMKFAEA